MLHTDDTVWTIETGLEKKPKMIANHNIFQKSLSSTLTTVILAIKF